MTSVMCNPHRLLSCAPGNKEVWEVNSTSWRRIWMRCPGNCWKILQFTDLPKELIIVPCDLNSLKNIFFQTASNIWWCFNFYFLNLFNNLITLGFSKSPCILLMLCCNLEIPRWASNQFPGSHPIGFTGCLQSPIGISFLLAERPWCFGS